MCFDHIIEDVEMSIVTLASKGFKRAYCLRTYPPLDYELGISLSASIEFKEWLARGSLLGWP